MMMPSAVVDQRGEAYDIPNEEPSRNGDDDDNDELRLLRRLDDLEGAIKTLSVANNDLRDTLKIVQEELRQVQLQSFCRDKDEEPQVEDRSGGVVDIPNEESWKRMEVTTSTENEEEGVQVELEQDVFSLFFLSPVLSKAFVYSIAVIFFQYLIFSLILVDLFKNTDPYRDNNNPLNVPVHTDITIQIAQYSALLIAVVAQADLMHTIYLINVVYNQAILETHPYATFAFWVASCVARFLEGCLGVVVAFVFIVQSRNVLEIFFNFVAVEFVANLDNLAFQVASQGLVGTAILKATEKVKHVRFHSSTERQRRYQKLQQFVVFATIASMGGALAWIQGNQMNGVYLRGIPCQQLEISFPEQYLYPSKPLILNDTKRDSLLFRHDIHTATALIYPFFSGEYRDIGQSIAGRPVYFERGFDDVTSGMFYYCEGEQVWVFSIRAIDRADFPDSSCQFGWLMQSPLTEAYTLDDVGPSGWQVWTGSIEYADVEMECNFCFRNSDCGGHGSCDSKTKLCKCKGGYDGKHCEFELPFCSALNVVAIGETAYDYMDYRTPYDLVMNDGNISWLYNRPVYMHMYENQDEEYFQNVDVVFYSGTRWLNSYWKTTFLQDILTRGNDDINRFHTYWHMSINSSLYSLSDPTKSHTPVDAIWKHLTSSVGESRPYTTAIPEFRQYICSEGCKDKMESIPDYCGWWGFCSNETNACMCHGVFGGLYCEFTPADPYVLPLAQDFFWNFNESWINIHNSSHKTYSYYAERFWSNLTADELHYYLGYYVAPNDDAYYDYYYFDGDADDADNDAPTYNNDGDDVEDDTTTSKSPVTAPNDDGYDGKNSSSIKNG